MGVLSCTRFPSASVSVAVRRSEADPLREVRSVGAISPGMSHGSCGCDERERGVVDDDGGGGGDGMGVAQSTLCGSFLTNALGGGVNADKVVGDVLLLDTVVMAVSAANPAVAKVVNLMKDSLVAFPL